MTKYFIYARKSSEGIERQATSIQDQLRYLRQLAKELNIVIVKEFTESKSAKEPNRKEFNLMLQSIRNGEAQGILSWKLDRLSRNPIDSGQLQWMLQQGTIQHIKTIERDYYPKDNVLMMSVEMGMANQFIQDLRINTKRGMESKAKRGWFPGKAPLGYIANPNKVKGQKEIIIDEERFYLVRKIFDMILTGTYSVSEIHRIAFTEYNLTTSKKGTLALSNFYKILTNTFYFGQFEYPLGSGNLYMGNHVPMISEEEFDKVQIILGKKRVRKPHTKSFAFTGMIRCGECGAQITAEDKYKHQKNGIVRHYIYYHCTKKINPDCSQKNLQQKEIENQIVDALSRLYIPKEFINWALDILKDENRKETEHKEKLINKLKNDFVAVSREIGQLLNLKLKELISDEEYIEKKRELEEKKLALTRQLDNQENLLNDWISNIENLFDFVESAKDKFVNGKNQVKREILGTLGSNLQLLNGNLSFNTKKPMILLEKISDELKGLSNKNNRLEPTVSSIKSSSYRYKIADFSKLYPREESNLRPKV